jgi:hypothetical protein
MIIDFRIEDFGDLELRFSIDNDQRRQRLYSVRNGVRSCGFDLGNMKDRVYSIGTITSLTRGDPDPYPWVSGSLKVIPGLSWVFCMG